MAKKLGEYTFPALKNLNVCEFGGDFSATSMMLSHGACISLRLLIALCFLDVPVISILQEYSGSLVSEESCRAVSCECVPGAGSCTGTQVYFFLLPPLPPASDFNTPRHGIVGDCVTCAKLTDRSRRGCLARWTAGHPSGTSHALRLPYSACLSSLPRYLVKSF